MLLLFDFVVEPTYLGFVQILELILVLFVLPDKVILDIFVFSLDEIQLM